MRRWTIRGVVATAVAMLLWPVIAWADQTIQAAPPNRFSTTEITMDQGERLVFRNGDTVSHDVTASVTSADGKPLFKTATVASGKDAFVEGSQYLTEGHYDFYCSIHPNMKGSIHVTANGTAQPRPGAASPGAPDASRPADRTRPTLAVRIVSRTTDMARVRRALVVRVAVNELSHLELTAVARPRAGGPLVTVAHVLLHHVTGTRRVHVRFTRAGLSALRHHRVLAVVLNAIAIDPSGNMGRAQHGRTLLP